jgi:hypothetical protein
VKIISLLTSLTLLGALGLASCASKPPEPPKTRETFITLIKRDGTKQFSYTLVMEMPKDKTGGPGRGGHHGGPGAKGPGHHGHDRDKEGGDRDQEDQFALLFNNGLNEKLATTGFCRTGFNQLDKQGRLGATQLQGECNESATDEDRQQFPNPPPKKVNVDVLD